MKAKVKRLLREMVTVVVGIAVGVLLFLLIYSVMLTIYGIDPACAEEIQSYPAAYVDVHEGSSLNIRRSPGGEWKYMSLRSGEEVVILATEDGWALVSKADHIQGGWPPLGWVSTDYLTVCGEWLDKKSGGL
ncbi:MAG: hypothetical protein J6K73_05065 [Clostridia bacterium]|nr:hypothetical protein [Clostridia bacterium]